MDSPLRLILVGLADKEAAPVLAAMKNAGCEAVCGRAETFAEAQAVLEKGDSWDAILCHYRCAEGDGFSALSALAKAAGGAPFIILSPVAGEEAAVRSMKAGAADYVFTENLSRLAPAVRQALAEARRRRTGVLIYDDGNADLLRKGLEATVQAISRSVEFRDPHTAGHQRRVSHLACAIGAEMGLPEGQIDGLRMAAAIHDIGKLSIPSEILSKPAKLTEAEYQIIKRHPAAGFDILKGIDFPWPVARIVLEHHERIDGSGYPHGLTQDDLLPESMILAVADVVEAVASYRSYRPAMAMDVALDEIVGKKGIHYHSGAVDACIRLFGLKGYKIIP